MAKKSHATKKTKTKTVTASKVTTALVDRVADAIANHPEFRGSFGRIPSSAWVRDQIEDLIGRAKDEQHLAEMVIARRRDMIGRVRGGGSRSHATKKVPASARLFSGVYPTGIAYADKLRERDGDYMRVAFLPFSTLELEWKPGKHPPDLRKLIKADAAAVIARRGQAYPVSASGQTVTLGGGSKRQHATKKSPAQLQREIDEVLAKKPDDNGGAARVLKVSRGKTFAGQRSITAHVQYPGEKPSRVEFVGPSASIGGAGPVVMIMQPSGHQTFVTDPSRFGDFGPDWVRRFFKRS